MQGELYIRVKQALTWLKRNKSLLQKDIADKMGMAEASFTRALARVKEKDDRDFVISFHSAVSEYISLDYLLTGEGQLLATQNEDASDHLPQPTLPPSYDLSFMIEKAVDKATAYADQTINELRTRIAEKDEYIQTLKARIRDLESQLAPTKLPELNDYHFTMGAAESEKRL
jgi:hypothetical protein